MGYRVYIVMSRTARAPETPCFISFSLPGLQNTSQTSLVTVHSFDSRQLHGCPCCLTFLCHVVLEIGVEKPGTGAVPVVLAPERLEQEDHGFKTKRGYKVIPCLKEINN